MPVYTFNGTNPVTTGFSGKKSEYDRVFNNVLALKQGDQPLDQLRVARYVFGSSGTTHNLALPDACGVLVYDNANPAEISGLAGGRDGRIVLVRVLGAGYLRFLHDNAGSTAGNKITCASTNGQFIGFRGSALLWYDGLSGYWRCELLNPGAPITPTFSASDYSAAAPMVWTVASGGVNHMTMQQWGKVIEISMNVSGTTSGTASLNLIRTVPFGFTHSVSGQHTPLMRANDAGGVEIRAFGYIHGSSPTTILFYKDGVTNWGIGATVALLTSRFRLEVN